MSGRVVPVLRRAWTGFLAYLVKFGVVGLIGLVIDVALFNALRLGAFGDGWISTAIGAKTVSTSVAIILVTGARACWAPDGTDSAASAGSTQASSRRATAKPQISGK